MWPVSDTARLMSPTAQKKPGQKNTARIFWVNLQNYITSSDIVPKDEVQSTLVEDLDQYDLHGDYSPTFDQAA